MTSAFRIAVGAGILVAVIAAAGLMGCGPVKAVKEGVGMGNRGTGDGRPDDGRYLFEENIEPGMKGYGLTVMSMGKIERFEVEVIDVVRNFSPGNNAILVRCSGLGLEHSGIVAGMSGSPVYLQGKMIGAIAFGWGMAKDPIAGVQPIRQMIGANETQTPKRVTPSAKQQTQSAGGGFWLRDGALQREASKMAGWGALTRAMGKRVGRPHGPGAMPMASRGAREDARDLRRLVSPLMVSGLSASSMKLLQEGLDGTALVAVASGSGGENAGVGAMNLGGMAEVKAGEIKLAPGSSIAVPLITGDMDLSAIGTVTEVRDGRVYAFGHAFLGEGGTRLPMATGYIYMVMPNVNQSFKMGASMRAAGTLLLDEQTGVMGMLGEVPATVPVTVSVKDGEAVAKVYRYQMSQHAKLTPVILNALLNETLTARRNMPAQFTARVKGEVTFAGANGRKAVRVKIDNLGATESFQAATSLLPIVVLTDNPFENLQMTGLTLEATIERLNRGGVIRSVTVDRLTLAPGDEIHAVAEVERFQKDMVRIPIRLKVPADAADGDYELLVGTAGMALMQEEEYAPQRFDPKDIEGLKLAVERIEGYSADHLYATLVMGVSGAAIAGKEKMDLPPSRVAMYASGRRTDAVPVVRVVRQEAQAGVVLEGGGETFSVHVDRKANERYFSGMGGGKSAGPGRQGRGRVIGREPPASEPSGDAGGG